MNVLTVNLDDLINARLVESIRIEYKATWDKYTRPKTISTICAFANDLMNLNGGYIILGIDAPDGLPILPPRGLKQNQIEDIQRQIRSDCKKMDPEYQPLIAPEIYKDKHIIVIWVPAGDNRPYSAPDPRNLPNRERFVRQGAETVKATGESLRQLIELTARTPFDDRRCVNATILELSPILTKRFLHEIGSALVAMSPIPDDMDIYRSLGIVTTIEEIEVPKNIGILFFNERPHKYIPGAVVDVVQFGDDAGGNLIEEKSFHGPTDMIIVSVLDYLDDLTSIQLKKTPKSAQVERTVAYPYDALEEAIVNALYHRGYEHSNEPIKIYFYPDRVEITSYPGPVAGIKQEHFAPGNIVPPVPARNRRIGEFLKELRLAEMRGTGIPKIRRTMADNGSPEPNFDFDDSYFRIILPSHPRYRLVHALRESSYLWSIGETDAAMAKLQIAHQQDTGSGAIAGQLIDYLYNSGERSEAKNVFDRFVMTEIKSEAVSPYIKYFKALFSDEQRQMAREVIESVPEDYYLYAPMELAIAYRRLRLFEKAHTLLSRMYNSYDTNPEYLHDYAQTKTSIAGNLARQRNPNWQTIRRLQKEAVHLLRRAIELSPDNIQLAWIWFHLARTLNWLRRPGREVQEAYENAIEILPFENTITESFGQWKKFKRGMR